jgi:hypothetical protein
MKTYNNHPYWYNQPLRLTKEQKRDPLLVLDDFFKCYHLNEVRQTLWEWLTDIVSSDRSIAIEPLDRNNHMYFYEKVEEIIEAAYVMRAKIHKQRRRKEKKRFEKQQRSATIAPEINQEPVNSAIPKPSPENSDTDTVLNKPKRLIEYAEEDPLYVIKEVFNPEMEFTSDQLIAWLHIGLTAECMAYNYAEDREQLKNFQDDLLTLTDALYIIYSVNVEKAEGDKSNRCTYKISVLNQDQIDHPEKPINEFFQKYPRAYIDRELEDWLESAICYTGTWPNDLYCVAQLLDIHRCIQCLIKAAGQLLTKG